METDIGNLEFLVPEVVLNELENLEQQNDKKEIALHTLEKIAKFKKIAIMGNFADEAILDHSKKNRIVVATLDRELKKKLKKIGCSIISISDNKIILENQKI